LIKQEKTVHSEK